jgi:hypothetical protein
MLKNGDLEASAFRGLSNLEPQLGNLSKKASLCRFCPSRVRKEPREKGKELSRSVPREGALLRSSCGRKGKDSRLYSTRPAANAMHYTRSKVPAKMSRMREKGL